MVALYMARCGAEISEVDVAVPKLEMMKTAVWPKGWVHIRRACSVPESDAFD